MLRATTLIVRKPVMVAFDSRISTISPLKPLRCTLSNLGLAFFLAPTVRRTLEMAAAIDSDSASAAAIRRSTRAEMAAATIVALR
jgi:hypothetical protein